MGTVEIIVVFAALMALIAFVTIGIDWIGKPLKHRRFIPRLYRFDDEKLPVDAYGNTTFGPALPQPVSPPIPVAAPIVAASAVPATPSVVSAGRSRASTRPAAPAAAPTQPATDPRPQPAPRQVAEVAQAPAPAPSRSPFSDMVAEPEPRGEPGTPDPDNAAETALWASDPLLSGTGAVVASPQLHGWQTGMALDTTIDDEKPSLAIKAERFWRSIAAEVEESHFDEQDLALMNAGKAPRRTNPRSGKVETMQLTGLRRASEPDQVRMLWADEAVDPWSAR